MTSEEIAVVVQTVRNAIHILEEALYEVDPEDVPVFTPEVSNDWVVAAQMSEGSSPEVHSVDAGRRPRRYLARVRRECINRLVAKGVSREAAQVAVTKLGDEEILKATVKHGVPVSAVGDGTFLQWLIANLPMILKIVETLLPLILALL